MSQFLLRVGDLLHFHLVAPAPPRRKAIAIDQAPAEAVEVPASRGRDDLAFFSLSVEAEPVDPRVAMGRLALLREDSVPPSERGDFLRDQWLWLP